METVIIPVDGGAMSVEIARPTVPARTPRGLLVIQEAFGVNDHIRDVCGRFAALGFTAIAPDLFHRTAPGPLGYDDMEGPKKHVDAMTLDGIAADVHAAHAWLSSQPGIGANVAIIGYCMGGRVAYHANSLVPFRAAVAYYGNIPPTMLGFAAQQQAPILMIWGGKDPFIPPERRRAVADALTAAGKEHHQVVFSNGDHGFFNEARSATYSPEASRLAWALTVEFLRAKFGD